MPIYKLNRKTFNSPVELTLNTLSGKWKALILLSLKHGVKRYSELKSQLNRISHKVLSQQLKDLERDGLIIRKVHSSIPPKVEYSLSKRGEKIEPILDMMKKWGSQFVISE